MHNSATRTAAVLLHRPASVHISPGALVLVGATALAVATVAAIIDHHRVSHARADAFIEAIEYRYHPGAAEPGA